MIDAGLSCRETEKRMKRAGLDIARIKAIFISHEHGDHIKGIEALSRKHKLPVYITTKTMQHGRLQLSPELTIALDAGTPVSIGALTIHTFSKLHDAIEPHSFVVEGNDICIGIFTDIGTPCDNIIAQFSRCHAAFLESNYDEQMLEQGRYPYHLKRRIAGDHGHLSNRQALELFLAHKAPFLKLLLLAHLSKDNNSPEVALQYFAPHAGDTVIEVATRYKETPVYTITAEKRSPAGIKMPDTHEAVRQISLF